MEKKCCLLIRAIQSFKVAAWAQAGMFRRWTKVNDWARKTFTNVWNWISCLHVEGFADNLVQYPPYVFTLCDWTPRALTCILYPARISSVSVAGGCARSPREQQQNISYFTASMVSFLFSVKSCQVVCKSFNVWPGSLGVRVKVFF